MRVIQQMRGTRHMHKIVKTMIIAGLSIAGADGVIMAQKVGGINVATITPNDAVWSKAKFTPVILYPQTTIKLNDKNANKLNGANKALKAQVGAIYDGSNMAYKVIWSDSTQTALAGNVSDVYADGFAMQVAMNSSDPKKLPYIGMGSDDRPVLIYLNKVIPNHFEPNGNRDVSSQINHHNTNYFGEELKKFHEKVDALATKEYAKSYISEGFRSMTQIKDGSSKFGMKMAYNGATKSWAGVVAKSLNDANANFGSAGAIPVSFAVWDGGKLNRGGVKKLSGWTAVKFVGKSGGDALVKELTTAPSGDVNAGKTAVSAMCGSCHTLDASKQAPAYMAPSLTNIGGYSTNAYLAESIKEPSAVIVPGYNRNAHKNMKWYNVDAKTGKRTSTMPPMMTDDKQIANAVAYLKTLKVGVE